MAESGKTFLRWQDRIERGLARLIAADNSRAGAGRYAEALEHSRSLGKLNAPASRLFNGLGELSLRVGFALLAIVLLRRAEKIDPNDPLLKINMSRAQLSMANRFLLRAPLSGAGAYNLADSRKRLRSLMSQNSLPDSRKAETLLLLRRIEDRLEMWNDLRRGELEQSRVKELLAAEDREIRSIRSRKIPNVEELKKHEPQRTGFYYREYREQQRKQKERRR
ncbi:MAG: hypothetical protein FVQ81_14375 [Candidatus Glassbacteria bacterium]|nr:hypothetical protein [Candidatus Glassbacteria bacterium]